MGGWPARENAHEYRLTRGGGLGLGLVARR